jgi:hypothetical protein
MMASWPVAMLGAEQDEEDSPTLKARRLEGALAVHSSALLLGRISAPSPCPQMSQAPRTTWPPSRLRRSSVPPAPLAPATRNPQGSSARHAVAGALTGGGDWNGKQATLRDELSEA